MPTTDWRTVEWESFVHPHKAFRLEFPAHWEHRVEKDGESCGFGPRDRDNVGLWISIMPVSLDTERFGEDLPRLFDQAMDQVPVENIRRDESIPHHAMKADMADPDQGGHYWIVAGGDLVLFASSQVPPAERHIWNPAFDQLMASLEITRERELLLRQVSNEVLANLREKHPEQDYQFDEKGIRGRDHRVFLGNLHREVLAAPHRRGEIIQQYVSALSPDARSHMGSEQWDDILHDILPVLKPQDYLRPGTPTEHLATTPWLGDVLVCYAIRGDKAFRFITGWDLRRWEVELEEMHRVAIDNVTKLDWPREMQGSRQPGGGRMVLVHTGDSFGASRLLHPDFHRLFSGPLGSPFLAAVPNRDTIVAFTNRRSLKRKLVPKIQKDHDTSAYQISPRLFLVTADGIAPAGSR
ncbi:MAG: DUF1444 family protein [Planctomycetes bacterium]|nr:DUF1444 family protein [Planctomycetota bacterium]